MKIQDLAGSLAAGLFLAALASAQEVPTASAAPADHAFRGPGLWMDGVAQLSDLRGRPVLIEFWGRR